MSDKSKRAWRSNLVVLMHASNSTVIVAVPFDDPQVAKTGVMIDEKEGTWSAPPVDDPAKPRTVEKIGQSRYISETDRHEHLAIGVFDRTNNDHLNMMVHAATEAVRDHRQYSLED